MCVSSAMAYACECQVKDIIISLMLSSTNGWARLSDDGNCSCITVCSRYRPCRHTTSGCCGLGEGGCEGVWFKIVRVTSITTTVQLGCLVVLLLLSSDTSSRYGGDGFVDALFPLGISVVVHRKKHLKKLTMM